MLFKVEQKSAKPVIQVQQDQVRFIFPVNVNMAPTLTAVVGQVFFS